MSFLTALYKSYVYGEENDLIGLKEDGDNLILPIYHNSMKSNGKNIVEVFLDKDSNLLDARFLKEDEIVIFPVTEDSVARSSGVSPHPIFDNFDYIIQDESEKSLAYIEGLESWISYSNNEFLIVVRNFIEKDNSFDQIIKKLFYEYKLGKNKEVIQVDRSEKKEKETSYDFSKVFMTFKIRNFVENKDVSLTENRNLQDEFIKYIKDLNKKDQSIPKIICNISGKEDYLCLKHRPLIGSARLISQITANNENFKGRFENPDETIKIGKETSQKIILMVKSLLDGKNTCRWLGEMTYVISWFSDDITNNRELNLAKEIQISYENTSKLSPRQMRKNKTYFGDENKTVLNLYDKTTEDIVKSFTSGRKRFVDGSNYYMTIIDKVSNGRVAVKYFREIETSRLKDNLVRWQQKYHWIRYDEQKRSYEFTPSPSNIIRSAYGIEREKGLEVSKKSFEKDQYGNILAAIVEGRDMPKNIVYALEMNIRNRLNYEKCWAQVKNCALAILKDKEGIENNMLDRKDTDRSYLYGRLLALYEILEKSTYERDTERVTNAEKLWTSFVNKPVTMNFRLRNLMLPYEKKLGLSEGYKKELLTTIKEEISQIINLLSENYDYKSSKSNSPLGPGFIFGYEAELKFINYKLLKFKENQKATNTN